MTIEPFLSTFSAVSGLLFVVGSMLATELSLTVAQIAQPLKNARVVMLALLANFVLVPLLAFGITLLLPLDEALKIGLIVLSKKFRFVSRAGGTVTGGFIRINQFVPHG